MIIGHGLLAQSIRSEDRDDVTFFCSGVSNSLETSYQAFEREFNLLKDQDTGYLLVYFSTISVFNPSKQHTPYVRHKLTMEDTVRQHFENHIILRLPNMVGEGGNATNLFPYFLHAILNGSKVTIFDNTHRDLMDTTSLPEIIRALFSAGFRGTLNACYSYPPTVMDLYLYMCGLLKSNPDFEIMPGEDAFTVDNTEFLKILSSAGIQSENDWRGIVRRFVLLNSSHFA